MSGPFPAIDGDEREHQIVAVLLEAFAPLTDADPDAFRTKFRKMAADPWAFFRGAAPLFYADIAALDDPWADERTSRVWIQGDLHAENFGTYMDGEGILVFDVNDFDEAYLGHFTWDLWRFAASVTLMGWQKAIPDEAIARLIRRYVDSYLDQVHWFVDSDRDEEFALRLDTTEGEIHQVLLEARLVVHDPEVEGYFEHHGHRTAVSQRALQAHPDPLLGHTDIDGTGFVVAELSPYEHDLDWSELTEPAELERVMTPLGRDTSRRTIMPSGTNSATLPTTTASRLAPRPETQRPSRGWRPSVRQPAPPGTAGRGRSVASLGVNGPRHTWRRRHG